MSMKNESEIEINSKFKSKFSLIALTLVVLALIYFISTAGSQAENSFVITIPFTVAFLGGVLSLMSPCSAALLPAFFAYSFKEKTHLVKMTFVFWLGLSLVFVPLGFSASFVSKIFVNHQTLLFWIAGLFFFLFGFMVLSGKSWQILPKRFRQAKIDKRTPLGVFIMGVLFAFASGTCTAPILGSIFTLAAASGGTNQAVWLLIVYSFGLVMPLFIVAWFFEKGNFAQSKLIKGRELQFTFGQKNFQVHSTNLITALIFFALGLIFIATNGTNNLLNIYQSGKLTDFYFEFNQKIIEIFSP
ncbi:MAG: hypothetical protein COT81_05690 [Candidatus Buchananbacteria bacterium CG10_big_fil_rev_8_21_14_0_10_42_9]|uniref:Cytochrome C biogenesis protein transmembrane domain-containing protein n=1 Tax=Candidatus Buchananbacteria bacterium CG10_big_fil_rev_8_21_14_0_10_42_9 TaxID=1974526 RepID=A0A2H0VZN5_9BACT|nr:MAG: hypothetical protein COT81_05690 [Candidatus Buchananbacteria bacterium CG10_big_fil_rev_8_21_14_0_10_42_9]